MQRFKRYTRLDFPKENRLLQQYMSVTASSQKNCLQRVLILKRQKRKHAGWNMVSVKHLSIS